MESAESPVKEVSTIKAEPWMHLAHGLRSHLSPDGTFRINPVGDKFGLQFNDITPEKFAALVASAKLLIVGSEHFNSETQERIEWVAAASLESQFAHGQRPDRIWAQVRHGGGRVEENRAADLAEAISFHHLASDIALRRVSEAYHVLQLHVHKTKTPVGHRFTTAHVFELYSDVHSFFVNLGSLRDYLAAYASEFILKLGPCDRHSVLLKNVKGIESPAANLIRKFSDKAMKPIGLAGIGEYRDIVVHRSPVGSLTEWIEIEAIGPPLDKYGGVSLKLPGNPFDLTGNQVDALLIAHHALAAMCEYSQQLAKLSPIKPHIPHLTVQDGKLVEVPPVGADFGEKER